MAQTHASRLTIFICWACSGAQVPSEMIILTLPRRESSWFLLCQRENLIDEAKQVDLRLRRNGGREGKCFSDLVRRKQRLTAKQFSLPRLPSDSVVRCPWKGAQTSCHQQHTRSNLEQNAATNLTKPCLGWCASRGQYSKVKKRIKEEEIEEVKGTLGEKQRILKKICTTRRSAQPNFNLQQQRLARTKVTDGSISAN